MKINEYIPTKIPKGINPTQKPKLKNKSTSTGNCTVARIFQASGKYILV